MLWGNKIVIFIYFEMVSNVYYSVYNFKLIE